MCGKRARRTDKDADRQIIESKTYASELLGAGLDWMLPQIEPTLQRVGEQDNVHTLAMLVQGA